MVTHGNCPVPLGVLELCRQAVANLLLSFDNFSKSWPITFSLLSASGMLVNSTVFPKKLHLGFWRISALNLIIFYDTNSPCQIPEEYPRKGMYVIINVHSSKSRVSIILTTIFIATMILSMSFY